VKTFSHGGRFGDLFYALWTMRELGGGKLIITDRQQGNWSLDMARTLESFLRYQPYIDEVEFRSHADRGPIDYELWEAENDYNREAFPECDPNEIWPGSANIAKRYALHFDLTYRLGEKWLEAPYFGQDFGVIFHWKEDRTIRGLDDWAEIINVNYGMLSQEVGASSWHGDSTLDGNWLTTAAKINSAKLFLGVVSGPHALAEGLGKTRLVEQAPDCFNVSVLPPSQCINGWSNQQVIDEVRRLL